MDSPKMTSAQITWNNVTSRHAKSIHSIVLVVASALVGYVTWGKFGWTAGGMIFPLIWSAAATRRDAGLVTLAYYLAGSRVIPSSADVFFGHEISYLMGILIWLCAASVNAAPWLALWTPGEKRTATVVAVRTVAALVIGLLPPIAIIGWMSPLLSAATLFPGLGLTSFLLGGALLAIMTCLIAARNFRALAVSAAVVTGLAIFSTSIKAPAAPKSWKAINLAAGPFPHSTIEIFERNKVLMRQSMEAMERGAKVIVFPEQIAGWWGDLSTKSMLEATLKSQPNSDDVTIIFGAEVHLPDSLGSTNSLIFMSNDGLGKLDSRQSVPIALWRPWSEISNPADWTRTNVVPVGDVKALFSFCYEDFIPILHILSFIADDPKVIVSVSNAWWVRGTDEVEIQEQHIAAIAKIFGVPLLRAVNRG